MITQNNGEVIISLSEDELERAIANFRKLKPVLVDKMLRANFEGEGERDAKELAADFDVAIEAMERAWLAAQNDVFVYEWIPVETGLPEEGTSVLLSYKVRFFDGRVKDFITIACYDSENEDWLTDEENPVIISYPMAWMSMPEPYQAESEEG